jgi:sugar transferase (PEP-CTERM/EpsH1 system associated)
MPDAVFIAHRFPYPPDKGDRIRTWNVLSHLSRRFTLHVGCFVHEPVRPDHLERLREVARGACHLVPVHRARGLAKSLAALVTEEPLSARYLRSASMRRWVRAIAGETRPVLAVASASTVATYALQVEGARRVLDLVDVDSDKWLQYAATRSGPAAWVYRREAETLLRLERALIARFDASLLVTPHEVATMRTLAPEHGARLHCISNGVDTDYFSPLHDYSNPYPAGRRPIVMTGAMDYWPNIDAASWFAREILPQVRERERDAQFFIVGHSPAREVRDLGNLAGVTVAGAVSDTRPYIAHADVVVAPLRLARGVQNKVLEGMALARAVVTTGRVMKGILATAGRELLVADEVSSFADAVLEVLHGGYPFLGERARARVVAGYSWAVQLAQLDPLIAIDAACASDDCLARSA